MPALIRMSGPWGPALLVLGGVVLVLAVHAGLTAAAGGGAARARAGANTLLFWGVASVVLGFLGQCTAAYLALSAILSAPEISPAVVAEGFAVSFLPTLMGMAIFAFAAVVWGCLRFLPARGGHPAPALLLLPLLLAGCGAGSAQGPTAIGQGVWAFASPPSVFLWEFAQGADGSLACVVHDVQGGLKFMETPCASTSLTGDSLSITMPNGVGYAGRVELGRGRIEGRILYPGGGGMEAPLRWEPREESPTLWAAAPDAGAYVYRAPRDTGDGFPVAEAASAGIDPAALARTVEAIRAGEAGFLKSLLVARGGSLVLEEYFHGYGANDLSPIQSCTKSVSSLLVGVAIGEGRIAGVGAPLLDFFPSERAGAAAGWEELTLENLLTMSLALDWSPEEAENLHGAGPGAFRTILARRVAGRPGTDWAYVNMNANLLGGVLRQATGEHADVFARRALFEPLGITTWDWEWGKEEGYPLMDGSLRLTPRGMARLGAMVAGGGVWQGRRVVDEAWIRASLQPRLQAGEGQEGYGYLWWTMQVPGPGGAPLDLHFANGWGSQFILYFPALDLVVVTTGGNQENGKHLALGQVLLRDLLPGVAQGGGK